MAALVPAIFARRPADLVLFAVTAAELVVLVLLTPDFRLVDVIYVLQHLLVLGIALTRRPPRALDRSAGISLAIAVAFAYPYAQVIWLHGTTGWEAWPAGGPALVTLSACLSLASLLALGTGFGYRPALRELTTGGPYAVVRHPMYLAYLIGDLGYNLEEWNAGTLVLVAAGWTALLCRIHAEERIVAHHPDWHAYAAAVRYRLIPGVW
jgi:protein-S-isoprenylcysteine O-methyltransferase Ste14